MITFENNAYTVDGKKISSVYEDNKSFRHPFGDILANEPLMGFVAEVMDTLFPHRIKGFVTTEKNSDQKYDVGAKYYSMGVEIQLESEDRGQLKGNVTDKPLVFGMGNDSYAYLPPYTHSKVFREYRGEVSEGMLLYKDTTRGVNYELPLLVLPVRDINTLGNLNSWQCRWLKVCNEYYLAMSSEGQPNFQRLVAESVMKVKMLILSFAVEVLGLERFISEEQTSKKGKVSVTSEPLR